MEKEKLEALLEKITGCNEEVFSRLKRALGTASREEAADLVAEDPQAAKTAYAIFENQPVAGAAVAERLYPSAKRKTKIEF